MPDARKTEGSSGQPTGSCGRPLRTSYGNAADRALCDDCTQRALVDALQDLERVVRDAQENTLEAQAERNATASEQASDFQDGMWFNPEGRQTPAAIGTYSHSSAID